MKTPAEKYRNDPEYRMLVDRLENIIHQAQFTPSELREAAMMAAINYEMRRERPIMIKPGLSKAFDVLNQEFINRKS